MTTRREIRNAQVAAFFAAHEIVSVEPFSLTDEKFTGVFGEVGRNGFLLTTATGETFRMGLTNLTLGAPHLAPVKVSKREVKRAEAAEQMAELPSLAETFAEVSDDGEPIVLVDDAEVTELLGEFDTILAEYGVEV